ncbi:MAG: hypothetical protein QOJ02_3135 [Acidobacteriota bacterium]|jgi:hypothetical protein|nr:hypothetical protein [Acidobacteriota bacterium]
MKKAWLASVFSICFGLVAATTYILTTPTSAFAATGSAKCADGRVITCQASGCSCEDGWGCRSLDWHGDTINKETCNPQPIPPGETVAAVAENQS